LPDQAESGHKVPVLAPARMISRKTFLASMALVAVVAFIIGTRSADIRAVVGPLFGIKISSDTLDLSSVQDTYRNLKANFDGNLDTAKLIDGASRGLTAAAGDRYTVFMDKTEASDFSKSLSGQVSGVGAEIGIRTSQPTIVRIIADSPAELAGLKAGDTIIAVNGDSVESLTTDQVATKIRGDAGTSVKVTVRRSGESKDFTITRANITDKSVRSEIRNGVGILTISRFDTDTGDLARQAAQNFKSSGVKAVVLDLRDDGGGYLTAAQDVSSLWFTDKTVVTEKQGDKVTDTVKASGTPILAGMKTVVLVNGGTASASEIVSGALQDYGLAKLIGEKTYGKGSVQEIISLADGRELKVTVAKWYTPKGKNITAEGITPDQSVTMTAADVDAGRDPQLDAALAAAAQ